LRDAALSLGRIEQHYPQADTLAERLESNYIELKDCCNDLRRSLEGNNFTPGRLEQVDARLALMYDLFKKHRVDSVGELLSLAADYRARLELITGGDDTIAELERLCEKQRKELLSMCDKLNAVRRKASQTLTEKISAILVTLGMPMIRFEVEFGVTADFTNTGTDVVKFLFSANSISPLQPLADVASGGEMARVMLALKSIIAEFTDMPTLIFDEIDTGISGILAERMGRLMQQMGSMNRQVISITHLPQVAALGGDHYKVCKSEGDGGTRTGIVQLSAEERVREIAQMMSGEELTDSALDAARTLLAKR
jgi:DNA repair protein RecN (Recombination protein N)